MHHVTSTTPERPRSCRCGFTRRANGICKTPAHRRATLVAATLAATIGEVWCEQGHGEILRLRQGRQAGPASLRRRRHRGPSTPSWSLRRSKCGCASASRNTFPPVPALGVLICDCHRPTQVVPAGRIEMKGVPQPPVDCHVTSLSWTRFGLRTTKVWRSAVFGWRSSALATPAGPKSCWSCRREIEGGLICASVEFVILNRDAF